MCQVVYLTSSVYGLFFCFLIELFSCLPLTVTSFLFKSKSKKNTKRRYVAFLLFFYEMAAMSEQSSILIEMNQKPFFKKTQPQMSLLFEGGVGSNSQEGQMVE